MKKALLLSFLLNSIPLYAAPLSTVQWQGLPFTLVSKGASLASVIRNFTGNYSVPVRISNQISDTYTGTIIDTPPQQVIDKLSREYNLIWYYDNSLLYVYKRNEINRQLISLANSSAASAGKYLADAGLLDDGEACRVKTIDGISGLEVAGVPACIEAVTRMTQQLDAHAKTEAATQQEVQIFLLKYAAAADSTYQYRNQPVTVPGLVSVLSSMLDSKSKPGTTSATSNGTTITADPRQNAIIIRGSSKDIEIYAKLISELDVKPIMIEISVDIFEISSSDFNELGVDISGSANLGGGSIEFNTGNGNTSNYTVINNTANFKVKLNALAQNSKARILSRPSVVTLNNIQAVLDRNITFYTKVTGEKVANLESVTTGSLLRVTPHFVPTGGQPEVMLDLNIQDGQQTPSTTVSPDGLPQVQNSEISTHATLKPGESLLLGGFVQDSDTTSERKVPLLGDIPLIGRLFKTESHSKENVMRLFLIKAVPVNQGE